MTHNQTYYSFMYCNLHDSAFIVRGFHKYGLPDHFKNQNDDCYSLSKKCESCDWSNMGIVCEDNNKVNIVKCIISKYNKKYHGFYVGMLYNIFDEYGNKLDLPENSIFIKWLDEIKIDTKK